MYTRLLRKGSKEGIEEVLEACVDHLLLIRHFPVSFVGLDKDALLRLQSHILTLTQPKMTHLQLLGMTICYINCDEESIIRRHQCGKKRNGLSNDESLVERLIDEIKEMKTIEQDLLPWINKAALLSPILIWHLLFSVFTVNRVEFALHNLMMAQGVTICLVYFSRLYQHSNKSRDYSCL